MGKEWSEQGLNFDAWIKISDVRDGSIPLYVKEKKELGDQDG